MAKVQCYNCKKTTPVVAPRYRCKYCNYPLNKYVEQEDEPEEEIIIEKLKQDVPESVTIHDLYRDEVPESQKGIEEVLEKLKPDETVQKTMTGPVIIKKNLNPEKDGKIIAGWLVVHTEGRLPVTYELFEGTNVIGRPDGPHHVDIRVEDDEYVSRIHSIITIKKDFLHRFYYELTDNGKLRRGNPSTNGTYINGRTERLSKNSVVHLRDNDTIQVGTTKLVFKNIDNSDNLESAAHSVIETDFTSTVAIR
ncbi:MAG: FHA domain-containing protein [Chitinophagales bacterium]